MPLWRVGTVISADFQCAEFGKKQGREAGLGDALDKEGQSVVLWHEGSCRYG